MAIDSIKYDNNTYVAQVGGSEQQSSAAAGSIMPQSGAEQVSGEKSYTKDQVSGTEDAKKISLYKDIKKILEDNNVKLNLTENDLSQILASVCNKNVNDLTDNDIEKIKKQVTDIAKVFNYNKGETLEDLLFANDQVNVINIKSNVDNEIKKGNGSNYLNHKSVSETIERFNGLQKGDFKNLTNEQKIEYIQKFVKWSGTADASNEKNVTEQDNIERQAGTFRKLLCGTKDKEDRKLLLEAIEVMYKENQAPAFAELLASFSDVKDKQEVAGKAVDEGKTDKYIDGATKEQAAEIINVIAKATDEEHSQKLNTQLNEKLQEFVEANKDELVVIAKKIENGEELTEEEKKKQAILESIKGANEGKDSGFIGNEYIKTETKTQLVDESYRTYTEIDKQTGLNIKAEMMESLNAYIEEHPETNITKEDLSTIIENAENEKVSGTVSGQGSSSGDATGSEIVVASVDGQNVPFEQKVDKKEVEATQESLDAKRNEIAQFANPENKIVITSNTTLSSAYTNYGLNGVRQYSKEKGVSFITEAFSTNVLAPLQNFAGYMLKGKSKDDQVAAFTTFGVDRNSMERFISQEAKEESIDEAKSREAKEQIERIAQA